MDTKGTKKQRRCFLNLTTRSPPNTTTRRKQVAVRELYFIITKQDSQNGLRSHLAKSERKTHTNTATYEPKKRKKSEQNTRNYRQQSLTLWTHHIPSPHTHRPAPPHTGRPKNHSTRRPPPPPGAYTTLQVTPSRHTHTRVHLCALCAMPYLRAPHLHTPPIVSVAKQRREKCK